MAAWPFTSRTCAGTDEADDGQGCADCDLQGPDALVRDSLVVTSRGELRVERHPDQLRSPFPGIPGVAVREGAVSGARGGGVDQRVPDVENQGELDDGEEEQRQQPAHEDEVHHRRAPLYVRSGPAIAGARPAGATCYCPTLSMAWLKSPSSAGPASARRAATRTADIRVIITQPGTSPRSGIAGAPSRVVPRPRCATRGRPPGQHAERAGHQRRPGSEVLHRVLFPGFCSGFCFPSPVFGSDGS